GRPLRRWAAWGGSLSYYQLQRTLLRREDDCNICIRENHNARASRRSGHQLRAATRPFSVLCGQLIRVELASQWSSGYQENMNWPPLRLSSTLLATSGRTAGQPWLLPMRP